MPVSEQPASNSPGDSPTGSTFRLNVLWDNVSLPYTAFFPRRGNPYQVRTPDPDYPVIHWDEPVQITEQPPTPPVPTREPPRRHYRLKEIPGYDPITFLSQYDRDRREAERVQFTAFRRVNKEAGRISPEGTVYYSGSNSSTEVLPAAEHVNGNPWGSPDPSTTPTTPEAPNTPPANHPDNHA
ncbi:hypothetical protein ARMGADRAFT_1082046 [Armillaria gallica]|uniref:Uncharacterized protein n=1 Tax=Armillaria gallica TaxID=47427 RepID=A0A2H3DQ88_ARMGA|nr:hypothetical protein ARMGADRAFT_1082046 [Armillaria gallica]